MAEASAATSETLTLASHRLFALRDGDVAVLSDESTGWCVVRRSEYDTLATYFGAAPFATALPDGLRKTVDALWEAGLLARNHHRNPATVRPRPVYPNSILLKLTANALSLKRERRDHSDAASIVSGQELLDLLDHYSSFVRIVHRSMLPAC